MKTPKPQTSKMESIEKAITALTCVILEATKAHKAELEWFQAHLNSATKRDLEESERNILMKLSEIKAQVAAAAARSKEAFGELSTKITALQTQIDELLAGAGDPDVTDEAFLADMQSLKSDIDALADIVPNPEPPADPAA